MRKHVWILGLLLVFILASGQAEASLPAALATTGEGVIELPVGLVKLVGGLIWTVGEVIILPFRLITGGFGEDTYTERRTVVTTPAEDTQGRKVVTTTTP